MNPTLWAFASSRPTTNGLHSPSRTRGVTPESLHERVGVLVPAVLLERDLIGGGACAALARKTSPIATGRRDLDALHVVLPEDRMELALVLCGGVAVDFSASALRRA